MTQKIDDVGLLAVAHLEEEACGLIEVGPKAIATLLMDSVEDQVEPGHDATEGTSRTPNQKVQPPNIVVDVNPQ